MVVLLQPLAPTKIQLSMMAIVSTVVTVQKICCCTKDSALKNLNVHVFTADKSMPVDLESLKTVTNAFVCLENGTAPKIDVMEFAK